MSSPTLPPPDKTMSMSKVVKNGRVITSEEVIKEKKKGLKKMQVPPEKEPDETAVDF